MSNGIFQFRDLIGWLITMPGHTKEEWDEVAASVTKLGEVTPDESHDG